MSDAAGVSLDGTGYLVGGEDSGAVADDRGHREHSRDLTPRVERKPGSNIARVGASNTDPTSGRRRAQRQTWEDSVARPVAYRRVAMTILVTLLSAGCAASPPSSLSLASSTPSAPSPASSAAPTLAPAVGPSPAPSPTPAPTAVPVPASWIEGPRQPAVGGVQFQDVVWTGSRFVAVGAADGGVAVFLDSTDGSSWHRQKSSGAPLDAEQDRGRAGGPCGDRRDRRGSGQLDVRRRPDVDGDPGCVPDAGRRQ